MHVAEVRKCELTCTLTVFQTVRFLVHQSPIKDQFPSGHVEWGVKELEKSTILTYTGLKTYDVSFFRAKTDGGARNSGRIVGVARGEDVSSHLRTDAVSKFLCPYVFHHSLKKCKSFEIHQEQHSLLTEIFFRIPQQAVLPCPTSRTRRPISGVGIVQVGCRSRGGACKTWVATLRHSIASIEDMGRSFIK